MAKQKKNELWITRTSAGYCLRYKDFNEGSSGYLDSRKLLCDMATYIPFAEAITAISGNLSPNFYSHGVQLRFDKHRKAKIPAQEARAFRCVIRELEHFAMQAEQTRVIMEKAAELLDR